MRPKDEGNGLVSVRVRMPRAEYDVLSRIAAEDGRSVPALLRVAATLYRQLPLLGL